MVLSVQATTETRSQRWSVKSLPSAMSTELRPRLQVVPHCVHAEGTNVVPHCWQNEPPAFSAL